MDEPSTILGVHLAARLAWLAPVSAPDRLLGDHPDRLGLGSELTEERGLSEFEESVEALLGPLGPAMVAVLDPGKSRQRPPPSASRLRGQLEAALMIACHRKGCAFTRVSHDAVEKALGSRPAASDFSERMAARLSAEPPSRWAERSRAYAAALVAVEGRNA